MIALTCSSAPEGFARWSLRLLEEKVVELNIVEKTGFRFEREHVCGRGMALEGQPEQILSLALVPVE